MTDRIPLGAIADLPNTDSSHATPHPEIRNTEVPEADFAEQAIPAHPDDTDVALPTGPLDREATEADLIDQSIPVPLDDEEH